MILKQANIGDKFIIGFDNDYYYNSLRANTCLWNLAKKELATKLALKKAIFLIKKHKYYTKSPTNTYKILYIK